MSKMKFDDWAVDWTKKHADELVPFRGFCACLHPEHGMLHVAKDVVASINQAQFLKRSIRKKAVHVLVTALLERSGWETPERANAPQIFEPKRRPKRKIYEPPADHKPLTSEEINAAVEEGQRAAESMRKRLDNLSAPYDLFDTGGLIDGGGAAYRRQKMDEASAKRGQALADKFEEARDSTLHGFATKLKLRATDVLMFLLAEGMEGVNVNTKLDEETRRKIEEHFKDKIAQNAAPAASGSLPDNAKTSPHKQPPFRPTHAWDHNRMRFD